MRALPTFLLLASLLPACAARQRVPASSPRSSELRFLKQDLTLRCGGVSYALLGATPVRSARIYDLLSQETFTRRYFVVLAEGRQLSFATEQLEGRPYPRKILIETRAGFRRVDLDGDGNIVRAELVADLGE